jgi:RNA polymerase sigma factor (sigma-70 family)
MPAATTMEVSPTLSRGALVIDLTEAHDRDLVERVRRRDADAFRSLFDRYAPTAKALAMRVVRQAHLAEEIVQEAFLAVWRNPDGYDGDRGSVRSWLMGTVHHRAVDLVRREEAHRRRAEHAVVELREEQADHADDVAADADRPHESALVRTALEELPDEQRDVIELMYFSGLSQSQIAERSGLPLGTVKSRTLLAMRRLRALLGRVER